MRRLASTRRRESVYDLTVADAGEFFANGALVHNCTWTPGGESPGRIDASVYLAYELLPLPASGRSSMAGAMSLADADLLGGRGAFGR